MPAMQGRYIFHLEDESVKVFLDQVACFTSQNKETDAQNKEQTVFRDLELDKMMNLNNTKMSLFRFLSFFPQVPEVMFLFREAH